MILLPAATRYEQEGGGTSTTTERQIAFSPQVAEPLGEARSEWRIFAELAGARAARPRRPLRLGRQPGAAGRDRRRSCRCTPASRTSSDDRRRRAVRRAPPVRRRRASRRRRGRARFSVVDVAPTALGPDEWYVSTRRGKQFNSMVLGDDRPADRRRARRRVHRPPRRRRARRRRRRRRHADERRRRVRRVGPSSCACRRGRCRCTGRRATSCCAPGRRTASRRAASPTTTPSSRVERRRSRSTAMNRAGSVAAGRSTSRARRSLFVVARTRARTTRAAASASCSSVAAPFLIGARRRLAAVAATLRPRPVVGAGRRRRRGLATVVDRHAAAPVRVGSRHGAVVRHRDDRRPRAPARRVAGHLVHHASSPARYAPSRPPSKAER